jgi:hypothetical protein
MKRIIIYIALIMISIPVITGCATSTEPKGELTYSVTTTVYTSYGNGVYFIQSQQVDNTSHFGRALSEIRSKHLDRVTTTITPFGGGYWITID